MLGLFFFKQKTAYEMRISDWSSDGCSSDLLPLGRQRRLDLQVLVRADQRIHDVEAHGDGRTLVLRMRIECQCVALTRPPQRVLGRSEERRVGKECVSPCRSRLSKDQ